MAENAWLGGASSTPQVDTLTVGGTIEAGDKFIITMTGENGVAAAITVSAADTVAANVAVLLRTAFNASTSPLFTGITAGGAGAAVVLTADSAGVPFYSAATTTESNDAAADDQTFVRVATTPNSGPLDFNTASNHLTGAVPTSSDNYTFDGRAVNGVSYGLNQSSVTLPKMTIRESYGFAIGQIGAKLRISVTAGVAGEPAEDQQPSTGSSLINLNVGTNQTTFRVIKTAPRGTSGKPPFQIIGTHASNALIVENGNVGVGTDVPGEAWTFTVINTTGSQAKVETGPGGTLATVNQGLNAGLVRLRCAATTVNQDGGSKMVTEGAGAIATANIGGVLESNSTGTVTALHVEGQGFADFGKSTAARTVTGGFIYGTQARICFANAVARSVTVTNGVDCLNGARSTQVDYGDNVNVAQAAP